MLPSPFCSISEDMPSMTASSTAGVFSSVHRRPSCIRYMARPVLLVHSASRHPSTLPPFLWGTCQEGGDLLLFLVASSLGIRGQFSSFWGEFSTEFTVLSTSTQGTPGNRTYGFPGRMHALSSRFTPSWGARCLTSPCFRPLICNRRITPAPDPAPHASRSLS